MYCRTIFFTFIEWWIPGHWRRPRDPPHIWCPIYNSVNLIFSYKKEWNSKIVDEEASTTSTEHEHLFVSHVFLSERATVRCWIRERNLFNWYNTSIQTIVPAKKMNTSIKTIVAANSKTESIKKCDQIIVKLKTNPLLSNWKLIPLWQVTEIWV